MSKKIELYTPQNLSQFKLRIYFLCDKKRLQVKNQLTDGAKFFQFYLNGFNEFNGFKTDEFYQQFIQII